MALAFDGSGNASHSFGAGTTLTFSLTTTSSPDRIIVGVFAFWVGSVPSISVSGSTLGSFTARGPQVNDGAGNHYLQEFYADAASVLAGETITVTITGANSNYFITTCGFGIKGASSYAFDANGALPGTSGTAGVNATVTTSNANDFIYAFIVNQGNAGSAGSGWTPIFNGNFLDVEYRVVSATQSALACTLGSDSTQIALGDAVQAAGGGTAFTLSAAQGTYTLTGRAQTLNASRSIAAAQGVYTLTGKPQSLNAARTIAAAKGTYALTGKPQTLNAGRSILAGQGTYALSGKPQTLNRGINIAAAQGTYTLNGQAEGLLRGRAILAAQGAYALNGKAVSFPVALSVHPVTGVYSLNGQGAVLNYTPAGGGGVSVSHSGPFFASPGPMTSLP